MTTFWLMTSAFGIALIAAGLDFWWLKSSWYEQARHALWSFAAAMFLAANLSQAVRLVFDATGRSGHPIELVWNLPLTAVFAYWLVAGSWRRAHRTTRRHLRIRTIDTTSAHLNS